MEDSPRSCGSRGYRDEWDNIGMGQDQVPRVNVNKIAKCGKWMVWIFITKVLVRDMKTGLILKISENETFPWWMKHVAHGWQDIILQNLQEHAAQPRASKYICTMHRVSGCRKWTPCATSSGLFGSIWFSWPRKHRAWSEVAYLGLSDLVSERPHASSHFRANKDGIK